MGTKKEKESLYDHYMGKTVAELKLILGFNDQMQTGVKSDLAWRCAYGHLFGAVQRCKAENRECQGKLKVDVNDADEGDIRKVTYKCPGYFDEEEFKFHGKVYKASELEFKSWRTSMETPESDEEAPPSPEKKKSKKHLEEAPQSATKKKRREEKGESSDEETETVKKAHKSKPACKYGSECYRKNPDHLRAFAH